MDAVFTCGISNTNWILELSSAASARIATVIIEETDTATDAMASPSGVFCSVSDNLIALIAHGSFRFMIFPVRNVRYVELPRIGV